MELRDVIRRDPMRGFQWAVVVLCICLTIIDGYEILVTSFTLSSLTKEWGLDVGQQGLVASIGTLGMGIGAAFLAPLADRFGRRAHILASLLLIVVGMTLSGLAPSFGIFLVFRFFAGLFLGGIVPSLNVLVSEYASDARRGSVMGIYGMGFPIGSALGGFLSIWLIGNFGWRGPFFFSAIVTALLTVWAFAALPESVGFLVERRPAGALEAYNKIGAKLGLPPDKELPPPTHHDTQKSLFGTLLKGMFTGKMAIRTVYLWLAYATLIAAFYFANSFTARLVTQSTGDNNIGIVAQALVSVGGIIGGLLFAVLATRLNTRIVTMILVGFGTIAYFAFAQFFSVTSIVLVLAVAIGIAANGGVLAYYAISPPIYPTQIRAGAVGLMMGFGRVVAFLAPNIAAFLLARGFTAPNVYQVYGVVLAVSALAVWLLHRTYSGDDSLDAMQIEALEMEKLDAGR